jgi:CheY-like chemotaxis protein
MGSTNGQEGVQTIESDRAFDCVLMDIQWVYLISPSQLATEVFGRMPILDGFEATKCIRAIEETPLDSVQDGPVRTSLKLNGRIPIFAVSASLAEHQREAMFKLGLDGWILKPIDFKRLGTILRGITDVSERRSCVYHAGCNWEAGGWLTEPRIHLKMLDLDP